MGAANGVSGGSRAVSDLARVLPGTPAFSQTPSMKSSSSPASLAAVLSNQKAILANQATIRANQKKLDRILANQATIKKNQATILANQRKILAR